jgi:hypothetical protein
VAGAWVMGSVLALHRSLDSPRSARSAANYENTTLRPAGQSRHLSAAFHMYSDASGEPNAALPWGSAPLAVAESPLQSLPQPVTPWGASRGPPNPPWPWAMTGEGYVTELRAWPTQLRRNTITRSYGLSNTFSGTRGAPSVASRLCSSRTSLSSWPTLAA